MKIHNRILPLALCLTLLPGCATTTTVSNDRLTSFATNKPAELTPFFRKLYAEGERNAVLNLNSLGLAAMETGHYSIAEKAFDKAIDRIDAIYANDPNAAKARSLWNEEMVKDFKGEPYERAMTYYYRGLLYLKAGDYQNARAMFLAADYQDTVAEKEAFAGDFGLMSYMAAWASYCDGDNTRANELMARAETAQPVLWKGKSYAHSYLGLVDSGTGPVKRSAGQYKELLEIVASPKMHEVTDIRLVSATAASSAPMVAGDVNFQATTRGGRPVQSILDGKAQFKSATDTIGNIASSVGMEAMLQAAANNNRDMANTGAAMAIVGLLSKLASSAAKPAADTRAWTSLPSRIYMLPGQLQATSLPTGMAVSFRSDGSAPAAVRERFTSVSGKCGISWARTESSLSAATTTVSPGDSSRTEKDEKFRAMLESDFGTSTPVAMGSSK